MPIGTLAALLDFENRRYRLGLDSFFPDVDSRFKFAAFIHGGTARTFASADCAFFKQSAEEAEAEAFPIAPADFALVNPNTGTAPIFRSRRDAELVLPAYRRLPVLIDRTGSAPRAPYPLSYSRMFDMTNDSRLFRTAGELEADGAYPVVGGAFERGNTRFLPLFVGRSIHLFDHRFASVLEDEPEDDTIQDIASSAPRSARKRSLHNPYSSRGTSDAQHADPAFNPTPRYWIDQSKVDERWPEGLEWAVAFRDIARPTDVRTAIACIVPRAAFGNTLPLLLPALPGKPIDGRQQTEAAWREKCADIIVEYRRGMPLFLGALGSLALDFVARCKVQSAHLNFYILEQLPIVLPADFSRYFGPRTAEEIVREDVLRLTYTSNDLAPFARDQANSGPPFLWDDEDRRRRRARLDAVFMLLYGFDRDAAADILDSFPILRQQEESRFGGRFRTRDLVLRFMSALLAGNPDAEVKG